MNKLLMAMDDLARSLEARRTALGWSQSELARRSGVTQSTISRMEAGIGKRPSHDILAALARALGTTVDGLLGKTEEVILPEELDEMAETGGINAYPEPERTHRRRDLLATWNRLVAEGKITPRPPTPPASNSEAS